MVLLWPGESESPVAETLTQESERASVERIEEYACAGFDTDICRRVTIRLESGPDEGEVTTLTLGTGGVDPDIDVGHVVRVVEALAPPGAAPGVGPEYTLSDFERRSPMLLLALIFCAIVVVFGRLRGLLSLAGLGSSLAVVLVFVVPAINVGESPLVVAVVGSFAVMLLTITLTHGIGPKSLAAVLGTGVSLMLTVGLAVLFTELTHLTGLSSEEAAFLQLNQANVSVQGLLLAGMVIAALGVLDDVTVSQSSTVLALYRADPGQSRRRLFLRALEVGRDHVSATVNTLVLAYVGASLPLLLIFSSGDLGFAETLNLELIAKEIVATLVGSIGLIAAMPLTTGIASLLATNLPAEELSRVGPAHVH